MNLEKDDLLAALDPTPAVEYNLVSQVFLCLLHTAILGN